MILAIDPGGTTGVAGLLRNGSFKTWEVRRGSEGFFDWWDTAMLPETLDCVIYENYVPRPGAKSQQLDALHIIGMLRYWCRSMGVPLVVQTPAQAKSFATNDKLKAAGWYSVGEDHGRDAARHMLVFITSRTAPYEYLPERERVLKALVSL